MLQKEGQGGQKIVETIMVLPVSEKMGRVPDMAPTQPSSFPIRLVQCVEQRCQYWALYNLVQETE